MYPDVHWSIASQDALDFTSRLLQKDPEKRMTAEEALEHPWIQRHIKSARPSQRMH